MNVIVAENSGPCYGVKRALEIALRTRRASEGTVVTLGDLIHNPRVISELEGRGIGRIDRPEAAKKGTVIIRTHGVSPDIYDKLRKKNIKVVDATCPIVKEIQRLVSSLARKDREIMIVGNREHPETRGLLGFSRGRGLVIENEEEAAALPECGRRAVLAQSTQDLEIFQRTAAALVARTRELEVYNTVCASTLSRQKATADLAREVDVMIIVGGRSSSNSTKLYRLAKSIRRKTYFIETATEIKPAMLRGAEKVGISGGASTPPEAIREAVDTILAGARPNSPREKSHHDRANQTKGK